MRSAATLCASATAEAAIASQRLCRRATAIPLKLHVAGSAHRLRCRTTPSRTSHAMSSISARPTDAPNSAPSERCREAIKRAPTAAQLPTSASNMAVFLYVPYDERSSAVCTAAARGVRRMPICACAVHRLAGVAPTETAVGPLPPLSKRPHIQRTAPLDNGRPARPNGSRRRLLDHSAARAERFNHHRKRVCRFGSIEGAVV